MILIAKPVKKLGVISTGDAGVVDLLAGPAAALISAVDYGLPVNGNPDGVVGNNKVAVKPDFRGGHPQGK